MIPTFEPMEIKQQIRTIDFMPTLLDLLNISHDKDYSILDGMSLIPLIEKQPYQEQYAFSETGNPLHEKAPPKEPNVKSIRTSKWKLIFNEYDDSKELYNLELDPNETKNLVGHEKTIESELWEKLQTLINSHD